MPRSAAHLQKYKWPKGKSGNPGGRKKGTSITALMRRMLAKDSEVDGIDPETGVKRKLSWAEALALAQIQKAAGVGVDEADTGAANFVAERTEGKVKDTLELVDKREDLVKTPPHELAERLQQLVARISKHGRTDPGPARGRGGRNPRGRGVH